MWQSMSPGMRNLPAALISLPACHVEDPTEVILFPTIPTLKSPSFTSAPSNSRTLFIDRSIIRGPPTLCRFDLVRGPVNQARPYRHGAAGANAGLGTRGGSYVTATGGLG